MAKAIALLLLLAVPAALAATTINFAGTVSANGVKIEADKNVTIQNTDADYSFRQTSMFVVPGLPFFKWGYASSIAINAQANQNGGSADGEFCLAFFAGPIVSQTIASEHASWASSGSTGAFSFAGAASTVVSVYESIQEIDASGQVVKTVNLLTMASQYQNVNTATITTSAGASASVRYVTLNSTSASVPVSLTFVLSDVLGVINIGGATVTPKSIETIIEVLGWSLANSGNHLRLNIVAATASVSNSGSGEITYDQALVQGEGPTQSYFRAAAVASVSGTITAVTVKTETGVEGDLTGSASWLSSAMTSSADFQGGFSIARVTVDFPAGAHTLTYDPAAGFEAPNSAARAVPLLALLAAAIVGLFNL